MDPAPDETKYLRLFGSTFYDVPNPVKPVKCKIKNIYNYCSKADKKYIYTIYRAPTPIENLVRLRES